MKKNHAICTWPDGYGVIVLPQPNLIAGDVPNIGKNGGNGVIPSNQTDQSFPLGEIYKDAQYNLQNPPLRTGNSASSNNPGQYRVIGETGKVSDNSKIAP